LPKNKIMVNKEIARAIIKMLIDSSCIFRKVCKRRRRLANAFLGKLVLGCFCLLGFAVFAG
jgi:hypothetical protein